MYIISNLNFVNFEMIILSLLLKMKTFRFLPRALPEDGIFYWIEKGIVALSREIFLLYSTYLREYVLKLFDMYHQCRLLGTGNMYSHEWLNPLWTLFDGHSVTQWWYIHIEYSMYRMLPANNKRWMAVEQLKAARNGWAYGLP